MLARVSIAALLLAFALSPLAAPPASALHVCGPPIDPQDPCCIRDCCKYDPKCVVENATHDVSGGGQCVGDEMICVEYHGSSVCVTLNVNEPPLPPISIRRYCVSL